MCLFLSSGCMEISGVGVQMFVTAGIWSDYSVKELQVYHNKEVLLKSREYLQAKSLPITE